MKFTSYKRALSWAKRETRVTGVYHEVKSTRWLDVNRWKWVHGYTVVLW